MMSFSWKQYEGQVINNTFPLQRYLGGSSDSAVFLTQLAGPQSSKAVVKLIPEGASTDLQLSLWRRASKLTHPNLLQYTRAAAATWRTWTFSMWSWNTPKKIFLRFFPSAH